MKSVYIPTYIKAVCKCGEQKIDISKMTNQYGYLTKSKLEWQCPKCWNVVELIVEKKNESSDAVSGLSG